MHINQTQIILSHIQQSSSLFIIIITKETRHSKLLTIFLSVNYKVVGENGLEQGELVIISESLMTQMGSIKLCLSDPSYLKIQLFNSSKMKTDTWNNIIDIQISITQIQQILPQPSQSFFFFFYGKLMQLRHPIPLHEKPLPSPSQIQSF